MPPKNDTRYRTHFAILEEQATARHMQFAVWVGPRPTALALAGRLTMTHPEAEHFRQLVDTAYDPAQEWTVDRRGA